MRTLYISSILCFALTAIAWGAFPSELTYSNGKTLRSTTFIRWDNPKTVVVKYAGGAAPIALRYLSDESRAAVELWRESAPAVVAQVPEPAQTAPVAVAKPATGQVFDKGFDLPYIFAGASVLVMERDAAMHALNTYQAVDWPGAVASSATDADGRFSVNVPTAGAYVVKVEGRRAYRSANARYVDYRWIEEIKPGAVVMLTQENAQMRMSGSVGWGEKGQGPGRF